MREQAVNLDDDGDSCKEYDGNVEEYAIGVFAENLTRLAATVSVEAGSDGSFELSIAAQVSAGLAAGTTGSRYQPAAVTA